jgi:hypothetical protein
VQNIKNLPYHQKLLSGQTYLAPGRITETLARHVRPPRQTCSAPLPNPDSRDLTQTCPAPRPDMFGPLALSRVNQAYPASRLGSRGISRTCPAPSPDMSDLTQFLSNYVPDRTYPIPKSISREVGRTCPTLDPNMSRFLTLQWLDSLGGYKRSPTPL